MRVVWWVKGVSLLYFPAPSWKFLWDLMWDITSDDFRELHVFHRLVWDLYRLLQLKSLVAACNFVLIFCFYIFQRCHTWIFTWHGCIFGPILGRRCCTCMAPISSDSLAQRTFAFFIWFEMAVMDRLTCLLVILRKHKIRTPFSGKPLQSSVWWFSSPRVQGRKLYGWSRLITTFILPHHDPWWDCLTAS